MSEKDTSTRIRQQRKLKGFTQEELAKAAGLSTMSIRRYENGERIIPYMALNRIADALGIPSSQLIEDSKNYLWDFALEQKLASVGCSIGFYEEDAYLWINYPDGTLEVTEEELKELNSSADSFMRFKLEELKQRHIAKFRSKKETPPQD